MFKPSTYLAVVLASFALALGAAAPADAQDYPTKPVRLVVAFGPGTSTDIVTRLFGNALAKELGQAVVVENRPGAGGAIGTNTVAKSPPDGYMLTMGTVGTHAINVGLFPRLPYDPLKEFVPIGLIGYTPTLLVVSKALPANNVSELVALSKARPDGIAFASAGTGTSGHLAGELLKNKSGAKMLHVPYKEGGTAVTDVITGQVQFMFYHPAAVLPHVQAGTLRAIGVSSAKRSIAAPDCSHADRTGDRRVRSRRLVRPLCAGGHAAGNRCAAARSHGQDPGRCGGRRSAEGAGGRAAAAEGRSAHGVHAERSGEMDGPGEAVRRPRRVAVKAAP